MRERGVGGAGGSEDFGGECGMGDWGGGWRCGGEQSVFGEQSRDTVCGDLVKPTASCAE